jgi:hypothetical protein
MRKTYEVAGQSDKRAIREFLKQEGQLLLPMVDLVERAELAIDEVIGVMGRATIEAVLEMSAEGVAGPKQAGKKREVSASRSGTDAKGARCTCRTTRSEWSGHGFDDAAQGRAERSRCLPTERCGSQERWRTGCWRS